MQKRPAAWAYPDHHLSSSSSWCSRPCLRGGDGFGPIRGPHSRTPRWGGVSGRRASARRTSMELSPPLATRPCPSFRFCLSDGHAWLFFLVVLPRNGVRAPVQRRVGGEVSGMAFESVRPRGERTSLRGFLAESGCQESTIPLLSRSGLVNAMCRRENRLARGSARQRSGPRGKLVWPHAR
jgi:hypothetical protein